MIEGKTILYIQSLKIFKYYFNRHLFSVGNYTHHLALLIQKSFPRVKRSNIFRKPSLKTCLYKNRCLDNKNQNNSCIDKTMQYIILYAMFEKNNLYSKYNWMSERYPLIWGKERHFRSYNLDSDHTHGFWVDFYQSLRTDS